MLQPKDTAWMNGYKNKTHIYVSLGLKWVSCGQHIHGSCFCIHSARLCRLVEALNPFTFTVIIDIYVPIAIFSIVWG